MAFVEDGNDPDLSRLVPDVLNLRSAPDPGSAIVTTLAPGQADIRIVGSAETFGTSSWVPIETNSGAKGWVNRRFLVRDVNVVDFCLASEPRSRLTQLIIAFTALRDDEMETLVDPGRGVWYSLSGGPPLQPVRADGRPFSMPDQAWYVQDGTGNDIVGSFASIVAHPIGETLSETGPVLCNTFESGRGGGSVVALANGHEYVNYLSVYDPGDPDNFADWRTIVIGFDLTEAGDWVVVSVVRFTWGI